MLEKVRRPLRLRHWNDIDWYQTKKAVRDLRQQIFRATQEGDYKKLKSLQRLMLKSRANAEISVRQATQINKGHKTPGVDGLVATTPDERTEIIKELLLGNYGKLKPVRRVYIPKAKGKRRPLGIPTILDRCRQGMVRNALEPQWEAMFEPCSYGFRPGRSCHDAIGRIFRVALPQGKKKWILDADIKGAFDNISHAKLMDILAHFPAREEIRNWLKAGVLEESHLSITDKGTPQGGVISPLLANIALHGMESILGVTYQQRSKYTKTSSSRVIIRYADDFVVFTESRKDAEKSQAILDDWLRERGLEISQEKTSIRHIREGFDFLGFNIREYTEHNADKPILLIKPSKEAVSSFRDRLREEWNLLNGKNITHVVRHLNPILRGWGNYYRCVASGRTFGSLQNLQVQRIRRWWKRTHPKKSWEWVKEKYGWYDLDNQFRFGDRETGQYLVSFSIDLPIKRHVLVKHGASPDNPEERTYWQKRLKHKYETLPTMRHKILAKHQKGLCPICKDSLFGDEGLEFHHRIPKSKGGTDDLRNLSLTHIYCHKQLHKAKS